MSSTSVFLLILIGLVIAFLATSVKVADEYERGVVFRLGRMLPEPKGPGLFVLIPGIDRVRMLSLQTVTRDIPAEGQMEVLTSDGVTISMSAVVNYRVVEPRRAIVQVENFRKSTLEYAQTSLRSVVGTEALGDLMTRREAVNAKLRDIVEAETRKWGIEVTSIEIKDLELPQELQRAMAASAEARREADAKVIAAEGENKASQELLKAAQTIAMEPIALQLRYLQTMTEIVANDSASTIIIPVPIDLLEPFLRKRDAVPPAAPPSLPSDGLRG